MTATSQTDPDLAGIQENYLALARSKRWMNLVLLILFVALLVGGFNTAGNRNAGGFWDGLPNILDFPADEIGRAHV